MTVFVVFEYLEDGSPIHGVFATKKAAQEFKRFKQGQDPFCSLGVEQWQVESLADVRRKHTSLGRTAHSPSADVLGPVTP